MSTDYVLGRRPARERKPSGAPLLIVSLLFLVLIVVTLMTLTARLKGPVASSSWLTTARTPDREAMAQHAFLSSQLALAGNDSINIVLDARAQKLWVVLKGVRLRECNLTGVALDGAIKKLVQGKNEAMWLERPFTLLERRGNLPDPWSPVQEGKVDTTNIKVVRDLPMEGSLVFDRNLVVHIHTPPTAADSLARRGFKGIGVRFQDTVDAMSEELTEVLNGPPKLDLYVQIRRDDAAAVLRALSVGGGMALHL